MGFERRLDIATGRKAGIFRGNKVGGVEVSGSEQPTGTINARRLCDQMPCEEL